MSASCLESKDLQSRWRRASNALSLTSTNPVGELSSTLETWPGSYGDVCSNRIYTAHVIIM